MNINIGGSAEDLFRGSGSIVVPQLSGTLYTRTLGQKSDLWFAAGLSAFAIALRLRHTHDFVLDVISTVVACELDQSLS